MFKPNEKWLFNSSSFIGNEQPDSVAALLRVFHNLYITYELTKKLNMAFLFDAGVEGRRTWWGSAALLQYKINKKLNAAARAEYYNDPHSVIITAFPATGIQVSGYSFNFDFIASSWLSVRTEVKYLNSAANVFDRNGQAEKKNMSLLLSLAAGF